MCGRYASSASSADLSALFGAVDETGGGLAPDYNIAPTDAVMIVRSGAGDADGVAAADRRRALSVARWGLLPSWAKHPRDGAKMINARAETVASSRVFAPCFARRRCLVPADGWFEWVRGERGGKQPYFMTRPDGAVFGFAGVWSMWRSGDEQRLTCSVLTTAAVGELAMVHDRMPLVLPPDRWDAWLDHDTAADADRLLAPVDARFIADIELRPVGGEVGDVRNDGPELLRRVDAPPLVRPRDEAADLTLF